VLRSALTMIHHADGLVVEPLLEIADSTMTYRRRYYAHPRIAPALHLLIVDASNARALAFQYSLIGEHLQRLPKDPLAPSPTLEERLLAHIMTTLAETDDLISHLASEAQLAAVDEHLGAMEDDIKSVSDAITRFYFSHAELRLS
jgi:uncharacterized alpha-E superfamily protein